MGWEHWVVGQTPAHDRVWAVCVYHERHQPTGFHDEIDSRRQYMNPKRFSFWYSDYGGESDVSLNCGRFYGHFVRPRMNKWVNRRMNEENNFFLIFRYVEPTVEWYWHGKNRTTRRKTCPSATLSTTNPTGLTWARTRVAAVRPATNRLSHGKAHSGF
jgi:hypothetical protein